MDEVECQDVVLRKLMNGVNDLSDAAVCIDRVVKKVDELCLVIVCNIVAGKYNAVLDDIESKVTGGFEDIEFISSMCFELNCRLERICEELNKMRMEMVGNECNR